MTALMGVILCGGESRRMGQDKGLIQKDGFPWAKHMADKLTPYNIPVVFSVNASQENTYSLALPGSRLITDHVPAAGPLRGLLSVHEQFPDKDLLLLGCDMLDMDTPTIQHLIEAYRKGGYSFYAYAQDGFFEPLCSIYTAAGLTGRPASPGLTPTPASPSLQQLLRQGKTKSLIIKNNEAFRNYNML